MQILQKHCISSKHILACSSHTRVSYSNGLITSIQRVLAEPCSHPAAPRCIPALEAAVKEVDMAYDSCNEAWARGEADKFGSPELHAQFFSTLLALYFQISVVDLKGWMVATTLHHSRKNIYNIPESSNVPTFEMFPKIVVRFVKMAEERMKKATFSFIPQFPWRCALENFVLGEACQVSLHLAAPAKVL